MAEDGELSPVRRNGKSESAFRTISEVSEELDVPQHVLRFWESKFPQVHPLKRGGGRRYYRPGEVALLRRIRELLYSEGYTIKGVQRLLRDGLVVAEDEPEGMEPLLPDEMFDAAEERPKTQAAPQFLREESDFEPRPYFGQRGSSVPPESEKTHTDQPTQEKSSPSASASPPLWEGGQRLGGARRRELEQIIDELEQLRFMLELRD
jgi:DNA-binding transcriptional MerR regulator